MAHRVSIDRIEPGRHDGDVLVIRLADAQDLPALQRIERLAGAPFRSLGMDKVADDEPLPVEVLATFQLAGRAWVAEDDGELVGYILAEIVDRSAHIEQVSVDPGFAGRRIGRQLICTVETWARERNMRSMTLTTYEQVPWNAPYYSRLGFVVLLEEHQLPQLRAIRRDEADRGLDAWPRIAMHLMLPQPYERANAVL